MLNQTGNQVSVEARGACLGPRACYLWSRSFCSYEVTSLYTSSWSHVVLFLSSCLYVYRGYSTLWLRNSSVKCLQNVENRDNPQISSTVMNRWLKSPLLGTSKKAPSCLQGADVLFDAPHGAVKVFPASHMWELSLRIWGGKQLWVEIEMQWNMVGNIL